MKKTLWIVLGCIVAGVALIAGLGLLYVYTAEDLPVMEADKRLVLRAADLAPYFEGFAPSAEHESFSKVRYLDDTEELTYEFASPHDDEPYISVTVTKDASKQDAVSTFHMEWTGQRVGLNIADSAIDLEERPGFYERGDRSQFGDVTFEGETGGHVFVAMKGNTVYALTLTGFVLEDPELWRELMDERIDGM